MPGFKNSLFVGGAWLLKVFRVIVKRRWGAHEIPPACPGRAVDRKCVSRALAWLTCNHLALQKQWCGAAALGSHHSLGRAYKCDS